MPKLFFSKLYFESLPGHCMFQLHSRLMCQCYILPRPGLRCWTGVCITCVGEIPGWYFWSNGKCRLHFLHRLRVFGINCSIYHAVVSCGMASQLSFCPDYPVNTKSRENDGNQTASYTPDGPRRLFLSSRVFHSEYQCS